MAVLDRHSKEGRELLAPQSKVLSLPATCAFEPLEPAPRKLAVCSTATFERHTAFQIPCDHSCIAAQSPGKADWIHCFQLATASSGPLNASLVAWALSKEPQNRSPDEGVQRSNWGGYQSEPDVFVNEAEDPPLALLQQAANAALDEISPGKGSRGACESAMLWKLLRKCRADIWVATADSGPLFVPTHVAADAWVNINRGNDVNFTHIHEPGLWSGVYFVQASDVGCGGGAKHLSGHLVFRGGRKPCKPTTSHTYMAVAPVPGSLWLFNGSIPHCVFSQAEASTASGGLLAPAGPARISIAINFESEVCTPDALANQNEHEGDLANRHEDEHGMRLGA